MPQYSYICQNCSYELEVFQQISKYRKLKKCKSCGQNTLIRNYVVDNIYVDDGVKTVGNLIDRNSSKKTYELEDRIRQDKINQGMSKFEPHIKRGIIDREEAKQKVEGLVDYKPPWGELDSAKKKEIFSGDKKEQVKKAKKYIEKG